MRILDLVNLDYGKAVMGNFRFYSDTEIFEFDVGISLVELKGKLDFGGGICSTEHHSSLNPNPNTSSAKPQIHIFPSNNILSCGLKFKVPFNNKKIM